jgi:hypothetical protein
MQNRNFLMGFLALFFKTLSAAIIIVPPPPTAIQPYIDSANPGDTIQLSAGTYIEQIQVISKNLTIVGAGQDVTIIQAPPPSTPMTEAFTYGIRNFWPIIMVDNQAAPVSQTVDISDLTVDGDHQQDTVTLPLPSLDGLYGNDNRFFAIGYHNANGTVQNVHTTNTRESANFNEVAGGGIVNASNLGSVTFNVMSCLVDFYQRQGIDCRGAALTANISNTVINRGYVLTPNTVTATPNGIQYSGAALGSIVNNTVESNISTVLGAQASGILPFGAGPNLIISGNTVNNNDIGIAAIQNANNLTIDNNILNFTTTPGVNPDVGIFVQDPNGLTTITSNTMNNIPDTNMELSSSTDQPFQLGNNQFIGSNLGLLIEGNPPFGPTVTLNGDAFVGTVGYYIQETDSPHDVWPSTATASFDGLISGHITLAEYNYILSKMFGKHDSSGLGLLLQYIIPVPPTLAAVNPPSGPTDGGNTVTITGFSFISSNTTVSFGGIPATNVVIISNTSLTATVPPGVGGTVDVTVTTPFGTTPIVSGGRYTYITGAPLPPSNFVGTIGANKFLNKTEYILTMTWQPSPSSDVSSYAIYKNGAFVGQVSASGPLVFTTCLGSKRQANQYEIVAVNSNNIQSIPVSIEITS